MSAIVKATKIYFSAAVLTSAISVVLLPITTLKLGPADYGAFALGAAISAITSGLGSATTAYTLATHLPRLDASARKALVSTALAASVGVALISAAGTVAVVALVLPAAVDLDFEIRFGIALLALAAAPGSAWTVAAEVLTLSGRARPFAIVTVLQSVVSAVVVLSALFLADLGGLSLFLGAAAASLTGFAGALAALRGEASQPSRRWLYELWRGFPAQASANLIEQGRPVVERFFVSAWLDLGALGIATHGQQYRTYLMLVVKSVSRAAWPINLEEARDPSLRFVETRESWAVAQIAVLAAGVVFATLGGEIIGLLTNNRFLDAQPYAVAFIAALLLQTAGKPQMSLLVAHGGGPAYSRLVSFSLLTGLAVLVVAIPLIGLPGYALAGIVQPLVLRIGLEVRARRIAEAPFQDHWVVAGIVVIAGCAAASALGALSLWSRTGLCLFVIGVVLACGRRALLRFLARHRHDDETAKPVAEAAP